MNIKELSVGNLVYYTDQPCALFDDKLFVCTVQNIYKDSNMVKLKWVNNTETNNGFLCDITHLEPIEINHQFLEKNDFEICFKNLSKLYYVGLYFKDYIEVSTNAFTDADKEIKFTVNYINIGGFTKTLSVNYLKYVHQLQNMFALNNIQKEFRAI